MAKNFTDIKIGDKFINSAFNKVDAYNKPIYPLETKKRNVVEVVMINEHTDYQNHIDQLVLKYVNGSGHVQVYDYLNDYVFNSTFDEWHDIEIAKYHIYKNIKNNNIFFVHGYNAAYYDANPDIFKKIGILHHDYDKNNDRDELSLSDI